MQDKKMVSLRTDLMILYGKEILLKPSKTVDFGKYQQDNIENKIRRI